MSYSTSPPGLRSPPRAHARGYSLSRLQRWNNASTHDESQRHSLSRDSIGSLGAAGVDVLAGQIGKVGEDFVGSHAVGEVFEDVLDGDPYAPDARLFASFAGFHGDGFAPAGFHV